MNPEKKTQKKTQQYKKKTESWTKGINSINLLRLTQIKNTSLQN